MSDTSLTSKRSSSTNRKKVRRSDEEEFQSDRSSATRCIYPLLIIVLSLIIVGTSLSSLYLLNERTQRDRERKRRKEEFKQKNRIPQKVQDWINKNAHLLDFISKFSKNHGSTLKLLINDIIEFIFGES